MFHFNLPTLKEAEILIRKDSRFTDVPDYVHSNLNMNYIYSGKCDYVINNRPVSLHQEDVAIFDKDVVRRKLYAGRDDIVINISMSNEFFDNSFLRQVGRQSIISEFMLHVLSEYSSSHNHYMLFRTSQNQRIHPLFCHLFIEYYSNQIYGKDMIQGYLHLIFVELLRLYHEDPDEPIHTICQKVGTSNQNYFYKQFEQTYHMSPNEYRKKFKKL